MSEGLRLTVNVVYDPHGVDLMTLSDTLEQNLIQAVGNGLFEGDTAAEVDTWDLEIKRVTEPFRWFSKAFKRALRFRSV
jgi:hypothetical protein